MISKIRLLPIVLASLVLLLGLHVFSLWTGFSAIATAQAGDTPAAVPAPEPGKPNTAMPADNTSSDEAKDPDIPGLNTKSADPPAATAPAASSPAPPAPAADARPKIPGEQDFMSASEIEVLQSLTQRREELDKRAAELDMREKLMAATEQRLDEKLAEIKDIQGKIEADMHTLDDNQAKQIASLVKVYETMKPKDAADIFEDLDKTILLEVASRISDRKMAPILAAMDPVKARDLTVMLAKENQVPGNS